MDPYIGEIRIFSGKFEPKNWAFCNGQLLPISQNTTLFSIIGTTYGGDGKTTFALPDLNGRTAMHQGNGEGLSSRELGEKGGQSEVTLTLEEIPSHSHVPGSHTNADQESPENAVWADVKGSIVSTPDAYTNIKPDIAMNAQSLQFEGGNDPHNNRQPYVGLNFIICLFGSYPPRA
ncbi:phage tail protein [Filobacillus milosensis]|uniref:Phage tail protein n=1 Tax=Filobacillus milosensis TaxID=94137 RepID=A0A4Y8IEG1_9BACI|nr:tail fiber protein [Filobacillus milosensis]TFB14678.1 phage tail protein [Filobacillus milosensis]